ncbi:hypothetical protein HS088_TW02G00559 [Tripterygium wilfordii]|uniref:Senescence regulator n=1 Tax=Tripterygium wilfordii TaxID=458696 RepID=A0A7J7DZC0_TRIWF|nr:uncharacterized protein LOC120016142 [Tripterygium wilfordii]KAF5751544.1 hypothetical protein HS088_TW02G00559 [Tripterygium wilfordii]
MATTKTYFARQNYRFLSTDHSPLVTESGFELDESDIYNLSATRSDASEFRSKPAPNSRFSKKTSKRVDSTCGTPSSLPVNIPDWSKILKDEYRDHRRRESDDDDDNVDGNDSFDGGFRIPPHEILARTRIASFSVHEGVGRTLKGRDLSRVRNAIWEKTGFQD